MFAIVVQCNTIGHWFIPYEPAEDNALMTNGRQCVYPSRKLAEQIAAILKQKRPKSYSRIEIMEQTKA